MQNKWSSRSASDIILKKQDKVDQLGYKSIDGTLIYKKRDLNNMDEPITVTL